MKGFHLSRLALVALPLLSMAPAAQAYVGPGAGVTAIGTVLALIGALLLAVAGFVWYPVKRLLARNKRPEPLVDRPVGAAREK